MCLVWSKTRRGTETFSRLDDNWRFSKDGEREVFAVVVCFVVGAFFLRVLKRVPIVGHWVKSTVVNLEAI